MNEGQDKNRRPLKSRGQFWSGLLLGLLLKTPLTPNQVSLASIAFALLAAVGFVLSGEDGSAAALLFAIIGMQGRLLCNLMDGMIAVEGQRASRLGEMYNEIPDRISDIIILIAAGCAYSSFEFCSVSGSTLGWVAALLAVLTAYIRMFGASLGAGQIFIGPMAKPHRMALLTAACVLEIIFPSLRPLIPFALVLMILGCILTLVRRLSRIVSFLNQT